VFEVASEHSISLNPAPQPLRKCFLAGICQFPFFQFQKRRSIEHSFMRLKVLESSASPEYIVSFSEFPLEIGRRTL
jgi:hypothetical protein